jgi:2-aminoadipate transaminase
MPENLKYSAKGRRLTHSAIAALMREAITRPEIVSFAAGLTDYETLPCAAISDICSEIVHDPRRGQVALQYGTTAGLAELRKAVLDRFLSIESVRTEKLKIGPDNVVIAGGSQQLLYLLAEIFLDPGDLVLVEEPAYFVLLELLDAVGAQAISVPLDADGMALEGLKKTLDELEKSGRSARLKMAYLNSYFQNPTGISYSMARKAGILQTLMRRTKALIVEDGAYRELRYEGADMPSLKSFDDQNARVAYIGTFSKSFAPGLKTGYGIFPDEVAAKVIALKGALDFGSANFLQHVLFSAHKLGYIDSHVSELRKTYRARRNEMLVALEAQMNGLARWRTPQGGFYFWLELADAVDTGPKGPLFSVASEEGVLYVPGIYCFADKERAPTNTLRLSFASVPFEKIALGVSRLAQSVKRVRR